MCSLPLDESESPSPEESLLLMSALDTGVSEVRSLAKDESDVVESTLALSDPSMTRVGCPLSRKKR